MSGAYENKGAMAATIVVAASDSLNKAAANYVCDGTADNVEIQAAIDALPAGGGKVVLLEGNYTGGTISLRGGCHLQGQGKNTIYKLANSVDSYCLYGNGISNFAVSDLTIDGNKLNQTAGSASNHGIYLNSCSYFILCKITVQNTGTPDPLDYNSGIVYASSDYSIIDGCYITGSNHYGINLFNGDYNIVVNNQCVGNGRHGIGLAGGQYNIIKGNECNNNTAGHGIWIQNGSDRNTIVGNSCVGNVRGITTENAVYYCTFSGNILKGNSQVGITLVSTRNCVITNNICIENAEEGIKLYSCVWVSILSNICINNSFGNAGVDNGITLGGNSSRNIVSGNCCTDNQGVKTQKYGIAEEDTASLNIIQANSVFGNLTGAIQKLAANTRVRINEGYVTENSGSATVLSGNTSIAVAHGLAATPTRIQITPRENPTNAVSFWWVDTVGAANFTINVNADPGASNLDFDWHAQVGEG